MVKRSETDMVMALAGWHYHTQRYEIMLPNVFTTFDNEVDLLCIRKSGLCDKFEIKLSRSDLFADKKKHVRYREPTTDEIMQNIAYEERFKAPYYKQKHQALIDGDMNINYFWYAVPEGLCTVDDIPDFAGLIVLTEKGSLIVKRDPIKLHRSKMTLEDKYNVARKSTYRFWSLKRKLKD